VEKDFVKRCVAVGGDMVELKNKHLFVNGVHRDEPYTLFEDRAIFPPVKVFESQSQYQKTWESGSFSALPPDIVRDNFGPVIVPQGCYFALGDNRDQSFDSRYWGPVEDKYVKGRALALYWPLWRARVIR
jgi:signal peptidase I